MIQNFFAISNRITLQNLFTWQSLDAFWPAFDQQQECWSLHNKILFADNINICTGLSTADVEDKKQTKNLNSRKHEVQNWLSVIHP